MASAAARAKGMHRFGYGPAITDHFEFTNSV